MEEMIIKPSEFRLFDNGVDVEELYNAEYWWFDGEGKVWIRMRGTGTLHEVYGDNIEIRIR